LIIGNNVLAHVPDINDFVKGVKISLKPFGVNTFEFPHLCKLVEFNQFDTIYHEHFSYLSLTSLKQIFERQGLEIFDVQELSTHGGSLRIFTKHIDDNTKVVKSTVFDLLDFESSIGINSIEYYSDFQQKINKIKNDFILFLIEARKMNKKVVGYGAAAKGSTLLNYAGVKSGDLIDFIVDASPHKQGKYMPGSRIPVLPLDKLIEACPDYVIIFPWNLKEEIIQSLSRYTQISPKYVVAIPELMII